MAAALPPTLCWVARQSMRFLATLTLAAIVLATGSAARAADARPAAHEPPASTRHVPAPLRPVDAADEPGSRPSCRSADRSRRMATGHGTAEIRRSTTETGRGAAETAESKPAAPTTSYFGDFAVPAGPATATPAPRLTGAVPLPGPGQRAPPPR